jgi:hypothetical protein
MVSEDRREGKGNDSLKNEKPREKKKLKRHDERRET